MAAPACSRQKEEKFGGWQEHRPRIATELYGGFSNRYSLFRNLFVTVRVIFITSCQTKAQSAIAPEVWPEVWGAQVVDRLRVVQLDVLRLGALSLPSKLNPAQTPFWTVVVKRIHFH